MGMQIDQPGSYNASCYIVNIGRRFRINRGFDGRNPAIAETYVKKAIKLLRRIDDTAAFQQEIKASHSLVLPFTTHEENAFATPNANSFFGLSHAVLSSQWP